MWLKDARPERGNEGCMEGLGLGGLDYQVMDGSWTGWMDVLDW